MERRVFCVVGSMWKPVGNCEAHRWDSQTKGAMTLERQEYSNRRRVKQPAQQMPISESRNRKSSASQRSRRAAAPSCLGG